MRLEESQMTMRVAEVVLEVRIRVVAGDAAVCQELLELPAGHPGKNARLSQRKHTPLVERQGQLLSELGLDLCGRQLHRIDNLLGNFQGQLCHHTFLLYRVSPSRPKAFPPPPPY